MPITFKRHWPVPSLCKKTPKSVISRWRRNGMALVSHFYEAHSHTLMSKTPFLHLSQCDHSTWPRTTAALHGVVPTMMPSIALTRWLWQCKHHELTVPKSELFSPNSFVHEILHRAHQLVRYLWVSWSESMLLLKAAALCAPSHPLLPPTSVSEVMETAWDFFFASLVVWRFFLDYCLDQSGLKFDCISLCTHYYFQQRGDGKTWPERSGPRVGGTFLSEAAII